MNSSVTLTQLRQQLFQLADRVIESGEPLVIERRGVRLQLVRADAGAARKAGRLARLKPRKQSIVVGPPLDPRESPSRWNGDALSKVAEPATRDWPAKPGSRRRPKA